MAMHHVENGLERYTKSFREKYLEHYIDEDGEYDERPSEQYDSDLADEIDENYLSFVRKQHALAAVTSATINQTAVNNIQVASDYYYDLKNAYSKVFRGEKDRGDFQNWVTRENVAIQRHIKDEIR